jgi:hypothetical protein
MPCPESALRSFPGGAWVLSLLEQRLRRLIASRQAIAHLRQEADGPAKVACGRGAADAPGNGGPARRPPRRAAQPPGAGATSTAHGLPAVRCVLTLCGVAWQPLLLSKEGYRAACSGDLSGSRAGLRVFVWHCGLYRIVQRGQPVRSGAHGRVLRPQQAGLLRLCPGSGQEQLRRLGHHGLRQREQVQVAPSCA